jgi:hypothetical protein
MKLARQRRVSRPSAAAGLPKWFAFSIARRGADLTENVVHTTACQICHAGFLSMLD